MLTRKLGLGVTQPVQSGQLTKRFLMSLPAGLYLVSGVGEAPGQPSFAEAIAPREEREAQWRRILEAVANGRLCNVFKSENDFHTCSLQVRYPRDRN